MGEVNKAKTHKVVMDNRNSLSMTGISKVTSIDSAGDRAGETQDNRQEYAGDKSGP
jgi:hypothetical protein